MVFTQKQAKMDFDIIASLVNIQMNLTRKTDVGLALRDCRNRILTITQIYDLLSKTEASGQVDFLRYADIFVNNLVRSFDRDEDKMVTINISGDSILMNRSVCVPCGLIVNELVTNSMHHAFPDSRLAPSQIDIHLEKEENGQVVLIVGDNGVGIDENTDFRKTNTLGLQLVLYLVESQLMGSIAYDRQGGSKFTIFFQE